MTRRLTNQDAFDGAMLNLLSQGHSCISTSGQARYRGPRGKSAIGALIPNELYVPSLEGKNVHHWLAAQGAEYDALRERLGSVTPSLLDELQDLHDRIGACMPSLYRHLAVAGAQRIAHSFKLSMNLVNRCATYQHLRGPQIISSTVDTRAIPAALPAAIRAIEVTAVPKLVVVPMPELPTNQTPEVGPSPTRDLAAASTPDLAVAAAASAEPMPLTECPQSDLDLIARGIARAIAAARPRSA